MAMVETSPNYAFWQEEQLRRLDMEDYWARREQELLPPVRAPQGHLPTLEMKRDEWAALYRPIMEGIERNQGVIDKNGVEFIGQQCVKMRELLLRTHRQTLQYRAKGRVWRGLRNRSEQYLLEFRRATQYYFANQKDGGDQKMDPAIFQTAVADFHAALTTTLRVLRMALGEEEIQVEANEVDYDSDGGEPIINLRINYSTPQPFSDLVQGIIEMTNLAQKRGMNKSGAVAIIREESIEEKGRLLERVKDQTEEIEKLERQRQDLVNARGAPPPGSNCAREKAEIDRLDNELSKAWAKQEELKRQCDQQTEYIEALSRGHRPVEARGDEADGVHLSNTIFDELCKHFEGYHDNAEQSLARVKMLEDSLRSVILHPDEEQRKKMSEKLKEELAKTRTLMTAKNTLVSDLRRQLIDAKSALKILRESRHGASGKLEEVIAQRDDAVQKYESVMRLEAHLKENGAGISKEVRTRLEEELNVYAARITEYEKDFYLAKKSVEDLQQQIVDRDAQIRGLKAMLEYDRDASRDRQEIQDLRERIIGMTHLTDNLLAKKAMEDYVDLVDPDYHTSEADQKEMDRLRKELEDYKDVNVKNAQELNETIASLRTEIAKYQKTIATLQAENDKLRAHPPDEVDPDGPLAKAIDDLAERDKHVTELGVQIADSSKRHEMVVKELQARLDDARLNASGISPEGLRALRWDLADFKRRHEDDQIKITSLEGQLDASDRRGQHQGKQLERYRHIVKTGEGTAAAASRKLDEQRTAEPEPENEALEEELDKAERAREKKAANDRKAAEEIHEKQLEEAAADQALRDESVASFDSNEEINKEHIARIKAQGDLLRKRDQELRDLQIQFNVAQRTQQSLQKQREGFQQQIRDLRRDNRGLREAKEDANLGPADDSDKITELEARLNELETDLATGNETGATLQLQRDAAIAENEENKQRMADLQTAHDAMAGEGPKLGLKRIKTRIANQAKATKARNIAAREAEEAEEEAAREEARKAKEAADEAAWEKARKAAEEAKKQKPPPKDDKNDKGDDDDNQGAAGGAAEGAGGATEDGSGENDTGEDQAPRPRTTTGRAPKAKAKAPGKVNTAQPKPAPESEVDEPDAGADELAGIPSPTGRVTRARAKTLASMTVEEKLRQAAEERQKLEDEEKAREAVAQQKREEKALKDAAKLAKAQAAKAAKAKKAEDLAAKKAQKAADDAAKKAKKEEELAAKKAKQAADLAAKKIQKSIDDAAKKVQKAADDAAKKAKKEEELSAKKAEKEAEGVAEEQAEEEESKEDGRKEEKEKEEEPPAEPPRKKSKANTGRAAPSAPAPARRRRRAPNRALPAADAASPTPEPATEPAPAPRRRRVPARAAPDAASPAPEPAPAPRRRANARAAPAADTASPAPAPRRRRALARAAAAAAAAPAPEPDEAPNMNDADEFEVEPDLEAEVIETVSASATFAAEPRKSSFVTVRRASRPSVTFDEQNYVREPEEQEEQEELEEQLEPEEQEDELIAEGDSVAEEDEFVVEENEFVMFEDDLEVTGANRGVKRSSQDPDSQSDRSKRARI
ncbi:0caadc5c-dbc6-472b-b4f4-160da7af2949 [Sclerotinia trifoliorum]|uniref:0caadc5c-dbc6-472b-b4f4-160da7af2949 n=1 Tax=Sclerotinia trifoliorum TaxID=28548 RepID=A0A8H2VQW8_9HELO|nr:0caadc5c-dbc6-472b-b4f4-160da7af2949 [Sclerotinia trifoliorum]